RPGGAPPGSGDLCGRGKGEGVCTSERRLCLGHQLVLFVRLVGVASNGHQSDAVRKVHELDTHRVPVARTAYRLDRGPDDASVRRDREQLVVRADHNRTYQSTTPLGNFRGKHTLSTPTLNRVLVDRRPLGVPTIRG